jgi:hypothetical protein
VVGSLPATPEYPFIVIMVDEIAFLTAYLQAAHHR